VTSISYLTLEEALEIVELVGAGPVRDLGLLDSALARPQASAFGEDAYATIELKAAALLHSLVKNHSLFDGNKRTAWVCTDTFMRMNGYMSSVTVQGGFDLVLDVAAGDVALDEIATRLQVVELS